MSKAQSELLGFAAYYGLEEMAVKREHFELALQSRIEKCIKSDFTFLLSDRKTTKTYSKILIADTFFSDSFPIEELKKLFVKAIELNKSLGKGKEDEKIHFKFLLLNPFSELARVRASALDSDSMSNIYWRLNTGLRNILQARGVDTNEDDYQTKQAKIEYLEFMLREIIKAQEDQHFEVAFTSEYTDLPCYIIGPYALKGVIFPDSTARLNPWWVYVDDPIEEKDSYTKYEKALKKIWEELSINANEMLQQVTQEKEKRRRIFVCWGGQSDNIKRLVFEQIKNKKFDSNDTFEAIDFEKINNESTGNLIPNIYRQGIGLSSAAIVLLLGEDRISVTDRSNNSETKNVLRARQNVVHEMGLVQSAFQPENVLIVMEEGIEQPSNLDGQMVFKASRESLEQADANLQLRINQFLDSLLQ